MLAEHSVQEVNPIPVEFFNIVWKCCAGEAFWLRAGKPDRLQAHQKLLLVARAEARSLSHDAPYDKNCVIEGLGAIGCSWMKVRLRAKVPVHTHTHTKKPSSHGTQAASAETRAFWK